MELELDEIRNNSEPYQTFLDSVKSKDTARKYKNALNSFLKLVPTKIYGEELGSPVHIINGVSTSVTAFIGCALKGPNNEPVIIQTFVDYDKIFGGLWKESNMSYSVYYYFLNGGQRAIIVRVGNDTDMPTKNEIIGSSADKTGIYSLDEVDCFNLLCIPPYAEGETTDVEVYKEALLYCKNRRAILVVDPPKDWQDVDSVMMNMKNLNLIDENAAIYFPRIKIQDPLNENQIKELVPSGVVAGIIARIDTIRGVWKAPAGIEATLVGVTDLSVVLTDAENGELNPHGINCLRILHGNKVVWGARTMKGSDDMSSEWKYVPVRRIALFIEESLYRGTQWVVFEPNNEQLWSEIHMSVEAFLHDLFRKGAFQGSTPKESYFVKCDKETTTQDDLARGIVNIIVGFAPLKPSEFVIIRIKQLAGQQEGG